MSLTPILLSGQGRSGSTWLMSLLASDRRMAFDLIYPYERKYLTYFAQFSRLFEKREFLESLNPDFANFEGFGVGGRLPSNPFWKPDHVAEAQIPVPDRRQWFDELWRMFSDHLCKSRPGTEFFAEKSPAWLPQMVLESFPSRTIYLIRDPRDVFVSANAFMRKKDYYSFMRRPEDTDLDHARSVCASFVGYVTNYAADSERDDTLLLRYEDVVSNRKEALARLEAATGLVLDGSAGAEHFASHGTAGQLAQTAGRWSREGLPDGVGALFEECAGAELSRLGHPAAAPARRPAIPTVDLGLGGVALDALAASPDGHFDRASNGHAAVHLSGSDFWFLLPLQPFDAAGVKELWLCVKGGAGDTCSLYWAGPGESPGEERAIHLFYQPSQHWQIIRFSVGTHPAWCGQIHVVRLDVFNSCRGGPLDGRGEIQWVRLV
jgi:hypothetical protein